MSLRICPYSNPSLHPLVRVLWGSSFDKGQYKFQLADEDAYFVHHMSMYEHLNHKKVGFEIAKNKTLIMSKAALKGECDNLVISKSREYLGLVPFYGGLPPNVTANLAVKSIGQGNSLVGAVKSLTIIVPHSPLCGFCRSSTRALCFIFMLYCLHWIDRWMHQPRPFSAWPQSALA
jgi:hypothetical protein